MTHHFEFLYIEGELARLDHVEDIIVGVAVEGGHS
jgi:hypothetical protein